MVLKSFAVFPHDSLTPGWLAEMDSLIAKAETIRPLAKRRKLSGDVQHKRPSEHGPTPAIDKTLNSVSKHTSLPKSLLAAETSLKSVPKHAHIANPKLRTALIRQSAQTARSKALVKDAELLLTEDPGKLEVEGDMEKTWRVSQDEIVRSAGQEAAKGRREWRLEGGPYKSRYSRNGRFVINTYTEGFSLQPGASTVQG